MRHSPPESASGPGMRNSQVDAIWYFRLYAFSASATSPSFLNSATESVVVEQYAM
ncbi:MAG: hypothetical protein M3R07_07735 [Gemmatimonadota bacterium]|nr:hypothetical protein [Gemmatimonadota bacterium]